MNPSRQVHIKLQIQKFVKFFFGETVKHRVTFYQRIGCLIRLIGGLIRALFIGVNCSPETRGLSEFSFYCPMSEFSRISFAAVILTTPSFDTDMLSLSTKMPY